MWLWTSHLNNYRNSEAEITTVTNLLQKLSLHFWCAMQIHPYHENYLQHRHPDWLQTLMLLSCFSRVWLCATPWMEAHQAPPALGFSRQEHWSGLPFPSPTHESEKWKGSCSAMSNSLWPHGLQPTRLLRLWDFPGKSTGVGCHRLLLVESYRQSNKYKAI